jgi:RNA polymerase sigma-70 factor (ECF subfamily)
MPSTPRTPAVLCDAELMRAEDQGAFAEVVRRHGPLVRRVARSLAGDEAEDVAQQAFLSAWLARGRFDATRGSLQAWLCTIARNRALDLHRSQARHGSTGTLAAAEHLACARETPDVVASRRDEASELRGALLRIAPEQRTALALAYYGDLSQTEIQARTDAPLGTVKGRLRLGLNALRNELAAAA